MATNQGVVGSIPASRAKIDRRPEKSGLFFWQDMRQKLRATKTPAERAKLMEDHMKLMQSGMAMLGQMRGGTAGMGGMMNMQMERRKGHDGTDDANDGRPRGSPAPQVTLTAHRRFSGALSKTTRQHSRINLA